MSNSCFLRYCKTIAIAGFDLAMEKQKDSRKPVGSGFVLVVLQPEDSRKQVGSAFVSVRRKS